VLAEKLGMTVAQLEAEMSVEEFIEWSIFFQVQSEETDKQRKEAMNGGKSNYQSRIRGNR
jgi:hypothetical protein